MCAGIDIRRNAYVEVHRRVQEESARVSRKNRGAWERSALEKITREDAWERRGACVGENERKARELGGEHVG